MNNIKPGLKVTNKENTSQITYTWENINIRVSEKAEDFINSIKKTFCRTSGQQKQILNEG